MSQLGFWSFAKKQPDALCLAAPDGREWTRGELLATSNQVVHGPALFVGALLELCGLQRIQERGDGGRIGSQVGQEVSLDGHWSNLLRGWRASTLPI